MSHKQYSTLLKTTEVKGRLAEDMSIGMHEPNKKEIINFLIVMSLAMVACMAGQYMNVCSFLFIEKYDWNTDKVKDRNLELMNTLPAIGTIIGSTLAGHLIQSGRARAFVLAMIIGIIGGLVSLIWNWYVFLFAKLIVGTAMGMIGVVVARYIEEWVPLKWFGISQAISLTCLQLGVLLATLMGSILPPEDDEEALKENETWRIVFLLQPTVCLVAMVLFFALVRLNPPKFYLLTGQEQKARQAIEKIYITNGDQLKVDNIITFMKKTSGETTVQIGFKEALWSNERYKRACWIAVAIMAAQCCTGYYALLAYSAEIFDAEFENESPEDTEEFPISAKTGAQMMALSNLVGSALSIPLVFKVGRRKIILYGQATVAATLLFLSIASGIKSPGLSLFLMCFMSFAFQLTIGPLAPLYAAEVCPDVGMAAVMICEDILTLLQVYTTPTMLDGSLGHPGTFAIFAIGAAAGAVFIFFYVPETNHLSEREKKELFWPGQPWGRSLKDNESSLVISNDSDQQNSEKVSRQIHIAQKKQTESGEPNSRTALANINESLLSSEHSSALDNV